MTIKGSHYFLKELKHRADAALSSVFLASVQVYWSRQWPQARLALCLGEAGLWSGGSGLSMLSPPPPYPSYKFAITVWKANWIIFISRD